jgi:hypothetical protein
VKLTFITPAAEPVELEIRHSGGATLTLNVALRPRQQDAKIIGIPIQLDRTGCEVLSKMISEEAKVLPR